MKNSMLAKIFKKNEVAKLKDDHFTALRGLDKVIAQQQLSIMELTEARKGLIRQCKVYKQQLRQAGIEPIGLYDSDQKPAPLIEALEEMGEDAAGLIVTQENDIERN